MYILIYKYLLNYYLKIFLKIEKYSKFKLIFYTNYVKALNRACIIIYILKSFSID